jgi:hypothetical protein
VELVERLDNPGRGRGLTEHALEPVIEPAFLDGRSCVTVLFPKGISISAM